MNLYYLIFATSAISLGFFLAIATDASIYLRGFAPYPQWIWPYTPGIITPKIILPIAIALLTISFTRYALNLSPKTLRDREKFLIPAICLIALFFQLSVLFASEGGIFIVIQRTIHPDINGYWPPALSIDSLNDFFRTFPEELTSYRGVAPYHPPGSIIFFWLVNKISSLLPFTLPSSIQPSAEDLKLLWHQLKPYEQLGSILSGFGILLLSTLNCVIFYYLGRLYYSEKVGLIAAILFIFIPSTIFFTPFTDVFFTLFPALSFYFYIRGLKKRSVSDFFISGLILFIGGFFTLQILATVFIYAAVTIYFYTKKLFALKDFFIYMIYSALGFFAPLFILYSVFEFNSLAAFFAIWENHDGFVKLRQHPLWHIYNWYDFFLFFGLPLFFIFIINIFHLFKDLKNKKYNQDAIFIGFILFISIINIIGTMNGETGRTWMPFTPFVLLPLSAFIHKIDKNQLLLSTIIVLQSIQVLVIVNYLVTIS